MKLAWYTFGAISDSIQLLLELSSSHLGLCCVFVTSQRCIATGYPLANIQWLKDGQPLRTGSRVRLLTKEHIKITSVTKEDRGMYQCFVRNDYDAVQSTAEMSLGGKLLFVFLCFAHLIYILLASQRTGRGARRKER